MTAKKATTKATDKAEATSVPSTAKVGDTITLPQVPSAMVRLPDGSVATCRGSYTVRHEGEHALITVDRDGTQHEQTFTAEAR